MTVHATYEIDPPALTQALADLGLTLDARVMIKRIEPRCGHKDPCDYCFTAGVYAGPDPFHGWHNIHLHVNQTIEAASAALWHELTHAKQCERDGSWARFDWNYRRQLRELGLNPRMGDYFKHYREIPYEAEAWAATELARAGGLPMLCTPVHTDRNRCKQWAQLIMSYRPCTVEA